MKPVPDPHYRHRFPAELISYAVWLYHLFSMSLRNVQLLLAQRRVSVSYESVRRRCAKFGAIFADNLPRPRPEPGDGWHLDGVRLPSAASPHYGEGLPDRACFGPQGLDRGDGRLQHSISASYPLSQP
jgi:putative transposase